MWISKSAEFDADFQNPLIEMRKSSCEKSYQRKSDGKTEIFTFITLCKRFQIKHFYVNFFAIFKRIQNQ
jgi:hypothetical protein